MSYYKSVRPAGPSGSTSLLCLGLVVALAASVVVAQAPPASKPPALKPPAAKLPALKLSARWTMSLPAPPAHRAALSAQTLFVPVRNKRIVALAVGDGAARWTIDLAASGSLVFADSTLVVPGDRVVLGIDPANGETRWRLPVDTAVSGTITVAGDRIYVPLASGSLVVAQLADGSRVSVGEIATTPLGSPLVVDGRVVVGASDGQIAAFDATAGRVSWTARLGGAPTTMSASGRDLYVGSDDNLLYSLDLTNGKRRWRWKSSADIVGTPLVEAKRVYFLSLDNQLRALDRGNGHQRWKRPLPIRPTHGPLRFGDRLLVAGLASEIRAYSPETGEPAGAVDAPDELAGPPMVVPLGTDTTGLLVMTRVGQVQLLEPAPPEAPKEEPKKEGTPPPDPPKPIKLSA